MLVPDADSRLHHLLAGARDLRIAAAPDFPFDPELIARVSPIEWKNVILYGEIKIDPDKLRIRGR